MHDSRLSIFEVAKLANCSIATVSNVVNNKGRVSKEKRKAVLKVVSSLGYRANSAGRQLRIQKNETFGLLFYPSCSEIFRNPFYAEVMEGLEECLANSGYHLLLAGHSAATSSSPIPSFLASGKVDGMILLGRFPMQLLQSFYQLKTPLLLLDSNAEWPIDSIVSDGFTGGVLAVRHLVAMGHRQIIAFGYNFEDYNIDLRLQGFLAGLKECRLPGEKQSVFRAAISHDDLYLELKKRLRLPEPPTALFTVNDTLACAMVERLRADNFKVPEQLSIVGYDDENLAANSSPALTTIRVEKKELGRVGAELLLKRVANPQDPTTKLRLPVKLIARDSVADLTRREKPGALNR